MTKSSFIAVKVETFSVAHSRIFKDRNLTSRTFQGLGFSFANSRTFQDFQGPWQPCDGLRATMVTKLQRETERSRQVSLRTGSFARELGKSSPFPPPLASLQRLTFSLPELYPQTRKESLHIGYK